MLGHISEEYEEKNVFNNVDSSFIITRQSSTLEGLILPNIQFLGCEDVAHGTDRYYECMIRVLTEQFHHAAGTIGSRVADLDPGLTRREDLGPVFFLSQGRIRVG